MPPTEARSIDQFLGVFSMHDQLTHHAFRSLAQSVPSPLARSRSPVVMQWTGREARALRLTNEEAVRLLARGEQR